MRLRIVVLVLAMSVAAPPTANADDIVINNGLAPPNPANVIDADNSFPDGVTVSVQNAGCDLPAVPCPTPWG